MLRFTFWFVMFFARGGHATCNSLSLTKRLMLEKQSQEPGGPGHTNTRRLKKCKNFQIALNNFDFYVQAKFMKRKLNRSEGLKYRR